MAMNHQNIISEKDKQLAEFKKQIDSLQKTESELSKLIEEQKAKNNVSFASFSLNFPRRLLPPPLFINFFSPIDNKNNY